MQTDLFLLGPSPACVTRALIAEWADQSGHAWLLMREWPEPVILTGDPSFSGELLLVWQRDAPIAPMAQKAKDCGDLRGLLRLNYDMAIDGVLYESRQAWASGDLSGVACNLQPHGGCRPVQFALGRWLARRLGMSLVDPVMGIWSDSSQIFAPCAGWRHVAPGALANPHWTGANKDPHDAMG